MLGVLVIGAVFGDWPQWGGTPGHDCVQSMKGAMSSPVLKWHYAAPNPVEWKHSAAADVDGDGQMEIVMGDEGGVVFCLNAATGEEEWRFQAGDVVRSAPAAMDVDGDGQVEVIFGSYDKQVYCLNGATGQEEWHYSTLYWIDGAPAVADLDGDGSMEVLITSRDTKLYCLDGTTGELEWFFGTGNIVETSPAVGDVNGDGALEVIFGSRDNNIYCVNSNGQELWSYNTGSYVRGSAALGDVDRDGRVEVIFGAGASVYCLEGPDGSLQWSYTTPNSQEFQANPALADVDRDRQIEVVIGCHDSTVYCLNGATGEVEWIHKFPSRVHTPGTLVDIDGDDYLEYLVPQLETDTLYCLNAENGTLLWKFAFTGSEDVHAPFAADVDGDGCAEVVVSTHDPDNAGYRVFVLDDPQNSSDCGEVLDADESGEPEASFRAEAGRLRLSLPRGARVSLALYGLDGRLAERLFEGYLPSGSYAFEPGVGRGVFLAVLKLEGRIEGTAKVVR